MRCPNCQSEQNAGKFCTVCGHPLPQEPVYEPPIPIRERKTAPSKPLWPWIVAATVLVLIMLVLIFQLFLKPGEATDYADPYPDANGPTLQPPAELPPETTEPPVETPPVEEPPVETPPVETPPVEEPPVEEPPVEEPPVEEPPAEEDPGFQGDLEAEITRIRYLYNSLTAAQTAGVYTEKALNDATTAYYEGDTLRIVTVARTADDEYRQFYYFDNGELFFAYHENDEDAHRFYFYGDQIIRWRYTPNAQDPDFAINYDLEEAEEMAAYGKELQTWARDFAS